MKKRKTGKDRIPNMYPNGTGAEGVMPYMGMIGQIPELADQVISAFENNPNAYSRQPIMNASAIRGMATPYDKLGYGGEIGDPINPDGTTMAPLMGQPGYEEFHQQQLNNYYSYPQASTNGADNIYGAYSSGGVQGKDKPSTVDQILNNIEYMKHNNPNSNTYKLRDSHHSINSLGRKPIMIAAYGGEADGEGQLQELQALADQQGISIEELISQLQNPDDMGGVDSQGYGSDISGEDADNIEPVDGENLDEEADVNEKENDDDEDDGIGETFKFGGRTKYNYPNGGYTKPNSGSKVPIEVEGKEILQTPDGKIHRAKGPKHKDGGVDINVPPGTKIYSNRLKVDGDTMAERKLKRAKNVDRIEKLLLKKPHDKLLQSSLQRTSQVNQVEEADDMALQESMNRKQTKFAYGGGIGYNDRTTYRGVRAFDDMIESSDNYGEIPYGVPSPRLKGLHDALLDNYREPYNETTNLGLPNVSPFDTPNTIDPTGMRSNTNPIGFQNPAPRLSPASTPPPVENPVDNGFTTGDYIGMAGNAFNAIAPILNTNAAMRATRPTINRYKGFGHEALDDNEGTQDMLNTMQYDANTDISTAENSARARNRNSAQSVNTLRALDALTDMGTNKARLAARDVFGRQMIGVRAQRDNMIAMRDRMEMSGQERADIENEAKTDNYFSNKAANLVNAGTQVESLGRNLNTSYQNKVDSNLIASMAKNPITIDRNGKIVNRMMSPEQVQRYLDMGYTVENGKLIAP